MIDDAVSRVLEMANGMPWTGAGRAVVADLVAAVERLKIDEQEAVAERNAALDERDAFASAYDALMAERNALQAEAWDEGKEAWSRADLRPNPYRGGGSLGPRSAPRIKQNRGVA